MWRYRFEWTATAIAVIIVAIVYLYTRSGASTMSPSVAPVDDPFMAQVVCQKAAKTQLKAPATAKFGDVTPVSLGSGRYQVAGPVDAENSYGALLRMNYDCTVAFTGGDSYRIEHIMVSEP